MTRQKRIRELMPIAQKIARLAHEQRGWTVLIVGGVVRSRLMGNPFAKDLDMEAFGPTTVQELETFCHDNGWKTESEGDAFLITFAHVDGEAVEIAVPRRDNHFGPKHTDAKPTALNVSGMGLDEAVCEAGRRRDFTINSASIDPMTGRVFDFHGGAEDADACLLRATCPDEFITDPLRVWRAANHLSRFPELQADPSLIDLCHSIQDKQFALSPERIQVELMKILTGEQPSNGLEFLRKVGWLPVELCRLVGLEQELAHHPEGDAWEHTLIAVDKANKRFADREDFDEIVIAVLLHDVGKTTTTTKSIKDNAGNQTVRTDDGMLNLGTGALHSFDTNEGTMLAQEWATSAQVRSWGHDTAGEPIAREFLTRLRFPNRIIQHVSALVATHMRHIAFHTGGEPCGKHARALIEALNGASIQAWAAVVECDHSARPPLLGGLPASAKVLLDLAENLQPTKREMHQGRLLRGDDLIEMGMRQGPEIGRILEASLEAQADGEFSSHSGACEWALAFCSV